MEAKVVGTIMTCFQTWVYRGDLLEIVNGVLIRILTRIFFLIITIVWGHRCVVATR